MGSSANLLDIWAKVIFKCKYRLFFEKAADFYGKY
jgi:hypothetical protein